MLGWFIFNDEGKFLSITTEQPDTLVNILRSQRKPRSSEQFLEGCKHAWNFESNGRKFSIISFLTFLSQHFVQERVSFSKVNTGAHGNWIYDHGVYLQSLLLVAMQLWCWTFLFADLFLPYFVSRCLCFNILCVKSFRLMEQRKQTISKLTCIERDIFWEEQIKWNTTLLRIKLAGGFESNTQ